jgi:predicted GNAT family acetyltransferase
MTIVREEWKGGGRWVMVVDGHEAEMTYTRNSPTVIQIDHTGVPEAVRARGIGQALVEQAVADARREGFRIVPVCSFAEAQFRRHPKWRDVLA